MILTPVFNNMTSSSYDVYCCKPAESIGTIRATVQHSVDTAATDERHSFGGGFGTNASAHLDMTSLTTTFKENGARRPLGVATSNQLPVLSPRQLTDEAVDRLSGSTAGQQVNAVNNKKRKSTAQHQTSTTASRRSSQQMQFTVDSTLPSAATLQTNNNCSPPGEYPQQQQPYVGPPRVRRSANARERDRTHSVNFAFTTLRTLIPTEPADRKLSKIETIRLATSYIGHLQTVLMAGLDEAEQPCMLVRKRSLQAAVMSPSEDDVTGNSTHICTFCLSASKFKVQQNNTLITSNVRATTTTNGSNNNNNNASCMFSYVGAFI